MRFSRLPAIFLVVLATMTTGCDPASLGPLRKTFENMGAAKVETSSDEEVLQMFRDANDQCPTTIDEFTVLNEVKIIDNQNIEFHYIVNDKGKRAVRGLSQDVMRKRMVASMKGNKMVEAVAERDLKIHHFYEDNHGSHLLAYVIDKAALEGRQSVGKEKSNPFITTVKADTKNTVSEPVTSEVVETVKSDPKVEEAAENTEVIAPTNQDLTPEPEKHVPEAYKPEKRSRDNPAGVQDNPFFK